MVDAVGSVAKVVGVALKIKEAVNTVHQNKKDCHHIKSRVDILNRTLSHHENNMDLMEDPAVMAALEALDGILAEALEIVTKCQEERNIVCVYYSAGNLSRQLSKVEQRISSLSSDAMLTIMSYQLLMRFQEGAPHPAPQIFPLGTLTPPQQPSFPQKMSKQNRDKANRKDWARTSQVPKCGAWNAADVITFDCASPCRDNFEPAKAVSPPSSSAAGPPDEMTGEPRSLVHRIAEVSRNIKEAVETVLQNKDDCVELGKRVNKVSILLLQLEDTNMADEPAMQGALEKLLATFRRAHTLVIACQRRGLAIVWLSTLPGRLSKQLHKVLDQMASNIADMTAIVLP